MTYQNWSLLFLGMVSSMLLYNVVQWVLYRERIYGLYTMYMLVWLLYFTLRCNRERIGFSESGWEFVRIVMPNVAYLVYLGFTRAFLELNHTHAHTALPRMLRISQILLLGYAGYETVVCLFTEFWRTPLHALLFTAERLSLIGVALNTILRIMRRNDVVTRLFITGSLMLVVGGLTSVLLSLVWPGMERGAEPFWRAHLTYLHVGIILELLFFSVGLAYRHRREAVRKAVVEQQLAREREQRRREHAEAELAVHQLRQQMTEMQMRALQAQINPHFLFNSLNSLSSLIADEPRKAEQFVDEMSSVYRYLLRANDAELTTLRQELNFIKSYYHLLKTRHGRGLHLDVRVAEHFHDHQLPPLTLQLLVENARNGGPCQAQRRAARPAPDHRDSDRRNGPTGGAKQPSAQNDAGVEQRRRPTSWLSTRCSANPPRRCATRRGGLWSGWRWWSPKLHPTPRPATRARPFRWYSTSVTCTMRRNCR